MAASAVSGDFYSAWAWILVQRDPLAVAVIGSDAQEEVATPDAQIRGAQVHGALIFQHVRIQMQHQPNVDLLIVDHHEPPDWSQILLLYAERSR